MTVKDFTNELYEAGHGSDDVEFIVKGEVDHTEELDRATGEFTFPAEVDHVCEIDDIYFNRRTGKLCVVLEIKDVNLN